MKGKHNHFLKFISLLGYISLFTFLQNFLWESLHALYFYKDHIIASDTYVGMMLFVSAFDVFAIIVMYFVVAGLKRDLFWLGIADRKAYIQLLLTGILIAIGVEVLFVYGLDIWAYTDLMPTIFGIGLTPLVQLSLTGLISVVLVRKFIPDCCRI